MERIQDLNLPISNISRIIRDALPESTSMDRETRIAIARATSVFIMYLASSASAIADKANHKTFSAADVFEAIEEMEFDSFLEPMKVALTQYRQSVKDKKDKRQSVDKSKADVSVNSINLNASNVSSKNASIASDVIEIDDDSN